MTDEQAPRDLGATLRAAAAVLASAGVASPRHDAEALAAHVLGTSPGALRTDLARGALRLDPAQAAGLSALVSRRAGREPLQHLIGTAAFRHLELAVGPGVFVPRPETEVVAQVAIDAARAIDAGRPLPLRTDADGAVRVVDLCTGSGAIALAVATEVPGTLTWAVELDAAAHAWAERNVAAVAAAHPQARVTLLRGDARTALHELDGTVDVVVSNPPYVPPGAVPKDPEVARHDPAVALYGLGPDGLEVPRGVVAAAARLLRPGGLLVMEHAEVQAAAARELLAAGGGWERVETRTDLTGRERMVVAVRSGLDAAGSRTTPAPATIPLVKDSAP